VALLTRIGEDHGRPHGKLPAPERKAREVQGISATRMAGSSPRSQVPVQTRFDREAVKPGDFAFETVARCGARHLGGFARR
jgi:hypothetical protein